MSTVSKPTVNAKEFNDPVVEEKEDRAARRRREREARKATRKIHAEEVSPAWDHDCRAEGFPIVISKAWAEEMGLSESEAVVCETCGDIGIEPEGS